MEIGAARRAMAGETECGDAFLVTARPGHTLVAVVDGLGHGEGAAKASRAVCDYLEAHEGVDLKALMEGCHRAVARTRGAALTLLSIDTAGTRMQHAAVGNVELTALSRAPIRALTVPGVVGGHLRKVLVNDFPLSPGDRIVVVTDGISRRFRLEDYRGLDAQVMAERMVAEHAKGHDDATCVAVVV